MTMQLDSGHVYWDEEKRQYWCSGCKRATYYTNRCIYCEDKRLGNQISITISELGDKVREFHEKMELPTHIDLKGDSEYLMFRNGLLLEEISELFLAIYRNDKIEIADGLADIMYVLIGTCALLNIPIGPLLEEVHRSNMTKSKGAVKGRNYERPNIARVLKEYC